MYNLILTVSLCMPYFVPAYGVRCMMIEQHRYAGEYAALSACQRAGRELVTGRDGATFACKSKY